MRNIKLTISYDGSSFRGWQSQHGQPTIQDEIEKALFKMTGQKCSVISSGRTDAGVHALAQVANFRTDSNIPLQGFLKGLNSLLPEEIAILDIEEVAPEFHARKSALRKEYLYRIVVSKIRLPLLIKRAWIVNADCLDVAQMKEAASCLIGTHDFFSFMASGSSVKNTIRTIFSLDLNSLFCPEYPDLKVPEIRMRIVANGFLRYMVRNITGLLIEVGLGKRAVDEVYEILKKKDRKYGARTAPAQGLYLMKVFY